MLRETETVRVMLRDTLIVLVNEPATDGEALNEQDLNSGLHERVTLTVGGLLIDAVIDIEDEDESPDLVRLAETEGDTLFDA